MDVAELLQPRGDDGPSGENLEYDPDFVDLELTAQPGEERQEGDSFSEAEEPDWAEVVKKSLAILERSHDIRAAVFYAEGILHTEGLTGFARATEYVRGCLEQYWDSCHPELDEDDDDDPTMRINAVKGLAAPQTVVRALRRTALTDSRMFGRMSLRAIEIAEGHIPVPEGMTEIPDTASIGAAFKETGEERVKELLAAAKSAQEDIKQMDAVFTEKAPTHSTEFDLVIKTLGRIARRLSDVVGGDEDDSAEEEAPATGAADAPVAASGGGGGGHVVGGINSPTDVSNALDRIIAYYRRSEPSSPLPLLLERAKRLVNADFLTIMNDMAPQGVENVNLIGGLEEDDDD